MANRFRLYMPIFTTSLVSSLILLVLMQVYIILKPNSIFTTMITIIISAIIFVTSLIAGIYFSRRRNSTIKKQLDDVLWYITALRRGKIPKEMAFLQNEITYDIKTELVDLSTYQQELISSLQRMANEKASLGQTAHHAAVMEERQRLARDLHDVVSQQLFALNMMSSAAYKMFDRNPELAKEQLKDIVLIAGKAQGEMRALLLHLRPVELINDSLCDGLIKLIQELKGKTSITFSASIDEIEKLTTAGEEHLFRIVQEALSNILRHSYADKVRVILEERENYVSLHISDNGKGFNPSIDKMASYGLKTMKERCEEIGGVMEIRSKMGEGTYIDIRIPTEGWKND